MDNINSYVNCDPRELPSYSIAETSHYLNIPVSTLRYWGFGKDSIRPIIKIADRKKRSLSFLNLIEAHILEAILREHKIPLIKIRKALNYLQKEFSSKHPLSEQEFETNGMDLFIEKYGQLINISKEGQLAIRNLLKSYLKRIKRDTSGIPIKLYPFTRRQEDLSPMDAVIDPEISFGRPVIDGTDSITAIIAERYKAGESIDELATDYDCKKHAIEEAIRCEIQRKAA